MPKHHSYNFLPDQNRTSLSGEGEALKHHRVAPFPVLWLAASSVGGRRCAKNLKYQEPIPFYRGQEFN